VIYNDITFFKTWNIKEKGGYFSFPLKEFYQLLGTSEKIHKFPPTADFSKQTKFVQKNTFNSLIWFRQQQKVISWLVTEQK